VGEESEGCKGRHFGDLEGWTGQLMSEHAVRRVNPVSLAY
jgi:hypothetical protein